MRKHELISSAAWMIVGVLFLVGSIRLGLGSLNEPGAGFFPFIMAACLISFSSIHFISSLIKDGQVNFGMTGRLGPKSDGVKRILYTIIFLLGFVLVLNHLGFVLTTLLFMLMILRFVEPQKWRTVFFLGGATTALSYLVFQYWLRANLPEGFLGF